MADNSMTEILVRHPWLCFGVVVVIQEALFLWFWQQSAAPFFLDGYDQVDYIVQLAALVANDADGSLFGGGMAQGWILHILGAAWLGVFGHAAIPVWSVQIPLILLELFLFTSLRKSCGLPWAWLGLGLFLAARVHSLDVSGATDYRHDYLSGILYGATAIACLRSDVFANRWWSVAAGIAAGVLLHARFLTLAYLVTAFPVFLLAIALSPVDRVKRSQRVIHLLMALGVAAFLASPFVILNWDAIENYYLVNHLSTGEIEARGFATNEFSDKLSFYLGSVRRKVLGDLWLSFAFLILICCAIWRRRDMVPAQASRSWMVLIGLCSPVPVLALGAHLNNYVAQVVLVPVLLLVVLATRSARPRAVACLAVIAFLLCPLNIVRKGFQYKDERMSRGHHQAAEFFQTLARRAPSDIAMSIVVADVHPALQAPLVSWARFVDTGLLGAPVTGPVGRQIYALDLDELWRRVHACDVLVIPSAPSRRELPAMRQLEDLRPELSRWAEAEMVASRSLEFDLDGGLVRVYLRRGFTLADE